MRAAKFGHTREKHQQNLGALLARVVPHCGFAGASARATRVLSYVLATSPAVHMRRERVRSVGGAGHPEH